MSAPDLSPFPALLLDMGKTFVFECDRFGPDEDFAATYRRLGGGELEDAEVGRLLRTLLDELSALYEDPALSDPFPRVSELACLEELPELERDRIHRTFAAHEQGTIPDAHADAVRALARRHRLGLVSNIWADPPPFRAEMERAGILDCFDPLVFSAVEGCVKPAPRLFRIALDALGCAPSQVVFIGDDEMRDIRPARALGMRTIRITDGDDSAADGCVRSLIELA